MNVDRSNTDHLSEVRNNTHRILVRKPAGKGQLERLSLKWEDAIKVGLKEIGLESVDWIHLV
jgi:hypothetical protein